MAKKRKRKAAAGDVATNRQAAFRYNLLEKLEAGIVLQGSEVKSLRNGSVQLKDAYAEVRDGELWLRNMHIAPYSPARDNHDPERPRTPHRGLARSLSRGRGRRPSASAGAGSTAAACAKPTRRAPRRSSARSPAAARSPCTCSRARCAGAPRARGASAGRARSRAAAPGR